MRYTPSSRSWLYARGAMAFALLAVLGAGCGKEMCVTPPCPSFAAVTISVHAPHGGPLTAASVSFTGAASGSTACQSGDPAICSVFGPRGEYDLVVSAPGYTSVERTVQVTGDAPQACGCTLVNTQTIDITLPQSG